MLVLWWGALICGVVVAIGRCSRRVLCFLPPLPLQLRLRLLIFLLLLLVVVVVVVMGGQEGVGRHIRRWSSA